METRRRIYNFIGKKVLMVEDNELSMEIAAGILESVGMVVVKSYSGSKAVEIFKKSAPETFDGILMDIQMPGMDGYETTKMIRELNHSDAKKVPIIAMTAETLEDDIKKAYDCGMNSHIPKPFDTKLLFCTLDSLL